MQNFRLAILWPLITICCLFALNYGCRKDFLTEKPNTDPTDRTITLEEIMMHFNTDGNNDRSGKRLPLYVRPLWDESYIVTNTGFPIIMTPVDTPCSCPDTRYGGNLAFYKDPSGNIQSAFVIWETDSLSTYSSNRAPLDSSSQFSGMMALVNQQDTIEKVVQVLNGRIMAAKKGKVAFADIPNKFIQGGPIAHDRDPWSWWKSLWGGVKCYNFGNNGINWNWWGNFWNGVADLFGGQTWDGEAGEHISYPPGSFFFGGFEVGWGLPEGYTEPGGSGLFDQQFSNQISTCTAINEYIQSIGEIPQGYSSIDLSFCQLINEVGLNGTEGKCLFSQYGTSNIEDLLSYWNASPKDIATADKLKAYIMGQCDGSFAILLTHLLKDKFFLEQHPIDLMEQIKNTCGFSSYNSPEWYDAFNSGLSQCTKEVIIDDWFDLTAAEKTLLLNNQDLFDEIGSFITTNGGDASSKDAAELLVQLINDSQLNATQLNWVVNGSGQIGKCLSFIQSHNSTPNDTNLAAAIVVSYIEMLASGTVEVQQFFQDAQSNSISNPVWDIIIEQLELALKDALIDIIPGGTIITLGPAAIEQFKSGDYLGALWTTAEIALDEAGTFVPIAKVASFGVSLGKKATSLMKFYDVMKKVYTLGDDAAYRVYQVLRNKIDDLYAKIEWTGNGAKVNGLGPLEVWDDLVEIFEIDPDDITSGNNGNEIKAEFNLGGNSYTMRFYLESTSSGEPTIAIKKGSFEFKMRF
jgi:hypothetical protein